MKSNWISNVTFCSDSETALTKCITTHTNTVFQDRLKFIIDKDTILHSNIETDEVYCDFHISQKVDIISNFHSQNKFDILIDGNIVKDIDFIFMVLCPYSKITCRFYTLKTELDSLKCFLLNMNCVYLKNQERKSIASNYELNTLKCFYKNGKCIPRNVQFLYFTN